MTTIRDQVTIALNKAEHGKRNGVLHPDDNTALANMQADLTAKIAELEAENRRIGVYLSKLKGHYS